MNATNFAGKGDHMSATSWQQRFVQSTRGKLVALLRRDRHTVEELSQELHLTDNAVRAHLATLERDGWVVQQGERRQGGSGKPAYIYELGAGADQLFPKAYEPVLRKLLDLLDERMMSEEMISLLQEAGIRIAADQRVPRDDFDARLGAAVRLFNDLGGLADVEEQQDTVILRGYSCPLAAEVTAHPEVCKLTEACLAQVVGQPVQEQCERGERPRCCFAIART
jgi:predicted ArsR family transcriptional regulator